jgi:hypothetical protein
VLTACGEPAPPPPETPPPPKPAEPEPPPPPKCEAIKEQCAANKDTRARIPGTDYVFTPPAGWIYAQLEEATIAQSGDSGPVMLLASFEPDKDARKLPGQRVELVSSLSEIVLLEAPKSFTLNKRKTPGRDDYAEQDMAGLTMSLWERQGAKRGEDDGPLLILSASLDGRELLGVGFAPKNDKEGSGAILSAIQTLEKGAGDAKREDSSEDEGKEK